MAQISFATSTDDDQTHRPRAGASPFTLLLANNFAKVSHSVSATVDSQLSKVRSLFTQLNIAKGRKS